MNARSFKTLATGVLCLAGAGMTWMVLGHQGHDHASVIRHDEVRPFEMNANQLRGIATVGTGAQQFEVWRSNVAVGSSTPRHRHDSEEVFVFLSCRPRRQASRSCPDGSGY